jgi:hypothetical protein
MNSISRALLEQYRCPEEFLNIRLAGRLSEDTGFFSFGRETLCYGKTTVGFRTRSCRKRLYDALSNVSSNGALTLPFDPTEVMHNLRWEKYKRKSLGSFERLARHAYYLARPFMSVAVRQQVQRFHARNWRKVEFPHWPIDCTVENISERVMHLALDASGDERVPFIWFWPNGASGCIVMTHDVETTAGLEFCSTLMGIDDKFDCKASFQIVPEERYDIPYDLLLEMKRRGFEINVQDLNHDGSLFENHKEFLRRAEIINRYAQEWGASGFRAGVLYRNPEWFQALKFSYDMSIPNVARLDPQRGGCCTVMPYFIGDILELPVTTTQDYMLFYLLNDYSIDHWKAQTELILQKHGLITFIVHPDYIIADRERQTYIQLLEFLREIRKELNLWTALPSQVDRWWRQRARMSVVKQANTWKVEGDETGRAVLAYVVSSAEGIRYEFAST